MVMAACLPRSSSHQPATLQLAEWLPHTAPTGRHSQPLCAVTMVYLGYAVEVTVRAGWALDLGIVVPYCFETD